MAVLEAVVIVDGVNDVEGVYRHQLAVVVVVLQAHGHTAHQLRVGKHVFLAVVAGLGGGGVGAGGDADEELGAVAGLGDVVAVGQLQNGAALAAPDGDRGAGVSGLDAHPAQAVSGGAVRGPGGADLAGGHLPDGDGADLQLIVDVAVAVLVVGNDADGQQVAVVLGGGDGELGLGAGAEGVGGQLLVCQHAAAVAVVEDQLEVEQVGGAAVVVVLVDLVAGHVDLHLVIASLAVKAQILEGVLVAHEVAQAGPVDFVPGVHLPALAVELMDLMIVLDQGAGLPAFIIGGHGGILVAVDLTDGEADALGGNGPADQQMGLQTLVVDLLPAQDPVVVAPDHLDLEALELPLVVAVQPDGDGLELLDVLQGDHQLDGALGPHSVAVGKIVLIAGPLAVELPDVVPHPVLVADDLLVFHIQIGEAEIDVGVGAGVVHVIRGDGDEITLLPVDGAHGQVVVVIVEGEGLLLARGHAQTGAAAGGVVPHGVPGAGGEDVAQLGALLPDVDGGAGVGREAEIGDLVGGGGGDAAGPEGVARRGLGGDEMGLCRRVLLAQDHADRAQGVEIREHGGKDDVGALLAEAGDLHVPQSLHGPAQRVDHQGQGDVPQTAVDVLIAHRDGGCLAELQVADRGVAAGLVGARQTLEARAAAVGQVQPEEDPVGCLGEVVAAHVVVPAVGGSHLGVDEITAGHAAPDVGGRDVEDAAGAVPLEGAAAGGHDHVRDDLAGEVNVALLGIPAVHFLPVEIQHVVDPDALAGPVVFQGGGGAVLVHDLHGLAEDLDAVDGADGLGGGKEELVRFYRVHSDVVPQGGGGVAEGVGHHLAAAVPVGDGGGSVHAALDAVAAGENHLGAVLGAGAVVDDKVVDVVRHAAVPHRAGAHLQDIGVAHPGPGGDGLLGAVGPGDVVHHQGLRGLGDGGLGLRLYGKLRRVGAAGHGGGLAGLGRGVRRGDDAFRAAGGRDGGRLLLGGGSGGMDLLCRDGAPKQPAEEAERQAHGQQPPAPGPQELPQPLRGALLPSDLIHSVTLLIRPGPRWRSGAPGVCARAGPGPGPPESQS